MRSRWCSICKNRHNSKECTVLIGLKPGYTAMAEGCPDDTIYGANRSPACYKPEHDECLDKESEDIGD